MGFRALGLWLRVYDGSGFMAGGLGFRVGGLGPGLDLGPGRLVRSFKVRGGSGL